MHEELGSDAVSDLSVERVVPTIPAHSTSFQEHITRYIFAADYVKGGVILDAGCGTGYGAAYLARRGAKAVFGVDIAPEAIEYSRTHYEDDSVSYSVMDCANLGFPDETFDAVVSLEVIEHLADPEPYLSEMRRVLKADGVFILSTPNKAIHSPNSDRPLNPFHFKEYGIAELEEKLSAYFGVVALFGQQNIGAISIWRLSSQEITPGEGVWPAALKAIRDIPSGSSTWTRANDWRPIEHKVVTRQVGPQYVLAVCTVRDWARPKAEDHVFLLLPSSPLEDLLRARERWIKWLETGIEYRDGRIEGLEEALQRIHRSRPYRMYQVAKRLLRIN